MSENNAIRMSDGRYTGDYTLRSKSTNDRAFAVDLREAVFRLKGLRPLRDTAAFARPMPSSSSAGVGGTA